MKIQKKLLLGLLCLAVLLPAFLTGCGQQTETPSSSEDSAVSQTESTESSETSSAPVSDLKDDSSSSGEDTSSASESSGGHSQILPDISADDPEFAVLFSENPLDAAYSVELEDATSTGKMIGIINKYIDLWKAEIDAAYKSLMEKTSGDAKAAIRKEQEEWLDGLDEAIKKIEEEAQGDGSARQLEIAAQIMANYRARAASLYSQLFQIDHTVTFQYNAQQKPSEESSASSSTSSEQEP